MRIFYPVIAIAYVLHLFLFDKPMDLQPTEQWERFRLSMAGLCLATGLYYASPTLTQILWYKVPALIMGATICYFQARVLVWYDKSVYFYAFGFVIAAVVMLRAGVALSATYASALIASQWTSFIEAGLDRPLLYSATAISTIFIVFARLSYGTEIRFFRATQENVDSQRQLVELSMEFTGRIRAFLPREISRRLFTYIEERKMTVLQAVEEVLRPREKMISCIFTDIRGFTRGTRTNSDFVDDGVIPNVRRCTRAIEAHGGIPRKIGDLIFAYFDDSDSRRNVQRCVAAAVDVVVANAEFNKSSNIKIDRHVLLASGDAVVGNLGGFDSSIEITALGNPVNLLSRIDELVKHPDVRSRIAHDDIVMDENTMSILQAVTAIPFAFRRLDLPKLGVSIRDFDDISYLWLLSANLESVKRFATLEPIRQGIQDEHIRDTRDEVQATCA